MVILQGDVFWFDPGIPYGSAPGFLRPHVVVQNDAFNSSRIRTTVLCSITSNLGRAKAAGNVLLHKGEANLSRASVVNVSHIVTVDKSLLKEKIGTLSQSRVREIDAGLRAVLGPREVPRSPHQP